MNAARLVGVVWLLAAAGAMGQETGAPADEAAEEPAPRVDASSYTARGATDEIVLDRTEVTGNRELPKVLYIVPWQQSDPGALTGRPVNTLLDEVLAPIDREEFLRQVDYYSDLYGDAGDVPKDASVAAGGSATGD